MSAAAAPRSASPPGAGAGAPAATAAAAAACTGGNVELPFSAAADRNKAPILGLLSSVLPANAKVLEIASGTGQHAAHFAAAHPRWDWQPSDIEARALEGIAARCAGLANVRRPILLDVLGVLDPSVANSLGGPFDAIFCANMLHVAPWAACAGLMRLAARALAPGGALVVYGPFIEDEVPTAPGNVAFDADLRSRNPQWALRRVADVDQDAVRVGLRRVQRQAMPANNLTLVFRRLRG